MAERCPDENELLDLVSGKRPSVEVAQHVASCATCSAVLADAFGVPDDDALTAGTMLGPYRIVREIGRGGVGIVYEAIDDRLDRAAAVKVLRRSSPEARARLLREARVLAKVAHRNVVSIFDVGESGSIAYFAMELIRGQSLRERMTGAPRTEIVRILREAGHGLAAAHRAGVVHRDVKPANILVDEAGRTVVVDFGLAAIARSETPEGGTPAYMPPEQIAGRDTDERSDQFAFCASLVHAVTGVLPFRGATLPELRAAIERGELAPAALARLPASLRRVAIRGLSADPARRFASMDELLAQLARRSRVLVGGAVVSAAVVVAAGVAFALRTAPVDTCAENAHRIDAVWTAGARGGVPDEAASAIDAWSATWRTAREAACRGAGPPGEDARTDRELACLDGALVDLGATLDVLTGPTDGAAAARYAIASLPPLARCTGSKPAAAATDPRPMRAARLRESVALLRAIGARGGVRLTVLSGTADGKNRVYRLALPEGRVDEVGPLGYTGDLWELPARGAHEAYAFDRRRDTLVTLDPTAARVLATTAVAGDIHHNGRALTVMPDGSLVGLFRGRELQTIDPATGATTPVSSLDAAYQLETMAVCPDGRVFAAATDGPGNAVGRTLVRLDIARGAVTVVGPIGADATDIDTLACDGRLLYGVDTVNLDTNDLVAIDLETGGRTLLARIPGPVNGLLVERTTE